MLYLHNNSVSCDKLMTTDVMCQQFAFPANHAHMHAHESTHAAVNPDWDRKTSLAGFLTLRSVMWRCD